MGQIVLGSGGYCILIIGYVIIGELSEDKFKQVGIITLNAVWYQLIYQGPSRRSSSGPCTFGTTNGSTTSSSSYSSPTSDSPSSEPSSLSKAPTISSKRNATSTRPCHPLNKSLLSIKSISVCWSKLSPTFGAPSRPLKRRTIKITTSPKYRGSLSSKISNI